MPHQPQAEALRAAIEAEITALRSQLQRQGITASGQIPRKPGEQSAPLDAATAIIEALELRIDRLEQVCDWMDEDPELRTIIDRLISNQIAKALRWQRVFNIGLNVFFLFAGWMLSIFGTPGNLARLLGRG